MKYELIRSVEDINTEKISIRDINKRYIDLMGNRYATRFNMNTRKVEVVRLVSSRSEALEIRKKIIERKRKTGSADRQQSEYLPQKQTTNMPRFEEDDLSPISDTSYSILSDSEEYRKPAKIYSDDAADFYDPYEDDFHYVNPVEYEEEEFKTSSRRGRERSVFIESQFLDQTSSELTKTRDRLFAMVNNFKKSRLFEQYKTDAVFDIMRQLDSECRSSVEKAINLYKEITHYPRPITYYLSKMSDEKKTKIDSIDNENNKMELIKRWELQETFENVYAKLLSVHTNLIRILDEIPDMIYDNMDTIQKMNIDNARTSCQYMIDEANRMLTKIGIWKKNT